MTTPTPTRRAVLYARLSVTTEESVSVERQLDAGRKYCAARGWEVVAEHVDDGVSATKNRPEERLGWRAVLDEPERFDVAVVWKVDRLARRVLDFLHADEQLQARGAGLVAVEDPIDMTTPQGRAFATMLAVFAEMEAAAISARVKAARRAIIAAGRRAGGRPPYGWRNVPNPDGPGLVLAKDPDRVGVVAALAGRALAGESLYALTRWLDEHEPVRARAGRKSGRWHEASVEAILRNPVLAGMAPYTPGRKPGEKRRVEVLRGPDGLPVVDEEVAVLDPADWRRLQAAVDARQRPGSRAYVSRGGAALLYGLARCGGCEGLLHRATAGGVPVYRCQRRDCPARTSVVRAALEAHVGLELLATLGRFAVVELVETGGRDPAPRLAEVEAAVADTLAAMGEDDADLAALGARLAGLKELRARARADADRAPAVEERRTGQTFAEAWAALGEGDTAGRRELLLSAIEAVYVDAATARGGRGLDAGRVRIVWREGEP